MRLFNIPDKFVFLFVLLSSLIFRATNLNLIEFKGDEATNLFLASRPIFGHPFVPGGTVSSVGILNPPIFNFILFPLTVISLDPKILSLFIGIINSLAIAFFYLILKRFYSKRLALIATLLLAFSPWSIIYSRKIWPQDFVLPVMILIFYSIHKIIIDKDAKYWTVLTGLSLFLIQLHQSGLFFVPLIFLLLFINRSKINFKFLLIGIIIGILPLMPYILYEIQNKCPDCSALITAGGKTGRSALSLFRPFQLMGQGDFRFLMLDDTTDFAQKFPLVWKLKSIFYIEYLLLPLGILLFFIKKNHLRTLTYITILLPISYFAVGVVPHMHYFIVLTLFLFLFVAFALDYFISSKNKYLSYLFSLFFIIFIINSIIFNLAFFQFLGEKKDLKGDYGPVFSETERKSKEILKGHEKDRYYSEMLLTSYLPKDQFYGTRPLGKLIYPHNQIQKKLPEIEKRLAEVPVDPRVINELISYYSFKKPTINTISELQKKSEKIKGYQQVLEEINKIYLEGGK